MKAKYEKSPEEMYADLAGVQEGGSIYTLKRAEPMTVEYIERVSRTSRDSPDSSKDRTYVYLSTKVGKKYRMAVDCAENRVAMEHHKDGRWQTFSNDLSGFRYRSPSHPKRTQNWSYDGR